MEGEGGGGEEGGAGEALRVRVGREEGSLSLSGFFVFVDVLCFLACKLTLSSFVRPLMPSASDMGS